MSTARQPAPVTPPPAAQEVLQRHYAGAAARFAAFAVDVAVSTGVFLAALGGLAFAISIITRHSVSWSKDNIAVGIIFLAWLFTYYAYSWGAAGKTAGMALLGVRVVASDGAEAGPRLEPAFQCGIEGGRQDGFTEKDGRSPIPPPGPNGRTPAAREGGRDGRARTPS